MCASCATEKGRDHAQANELKWASALEMDWRSMRKQSFTAERKEESSDQGSTHVLSARPNVSKKHGCAGYALHGTPRKDGSTGDTCTSSRETGAQDGAAAGTEQWGEEEYSRYAWKFMYKHGYQVSLKSGSYDGEDGIRDSSHHWPETPGPVGMRV